MKFANCRLLHVQLEMYACVPSCSGPTSMAGAAILSTLNGDEGDVITTFTAHDLSQQFVLPRHLAFRGDNGMYLRTRTFERHAYLQFSGRAVGDEAVANTVCTNDDGTFRVISNNVGKFWRRSPNWIWADSDDTTDDNLDTVFRAVRFGDVFALQNLGNGWYCTRLTTEGKTSCLNASVPSINKWAHLQLEEAWKFFLAGSTTSCTASWTLESMARRSRLWPLKLLSTGRVQPARRS